MLTQSTGGSEVLVNLTPHEINYLGDTVPQVIPPSGVVARLESRAPTAKLFAGVVVNHPPFGAVVNLPEPQEGVRYIVSSFLRKELLHRKDLISPAEFVRDRSGNVTGCRAFDAN
jgi:hypothetical protein